MANGSIFFMKTYNNLYSKIYSLNNIYLAYLKARRNKRYKKQILEFNYNLEENLYKIHEELKNKTYKHGEYYHFIIKDSKKRNISAPLFRDRVVHHSICNVIEPIFEKGFIFDSYACRKNKGTQLAAKRLQFFLKNNQNKYCLKCDISKYFDSINHDILMSIIKRKIKDNDLISLINIILKSLDSRFKIKGIPLGNLTSQLFANIFLNELDNFIKHGLGERYYIRYMDDFLILSSSKQYLWQKLNYIDDFLKYFGLQLNPKKTKIIPVLKGVEFVGYVIFPNHILLKKDSVKRLLKKLKKNSNIQNKEKIVCFYSYSKIASCYGLQAELFPSEVEYFKKIMLI